MFVQLLSPTMELVDFNISYNFFGYKQIKLIATVIYLLNFRLRQQLNRQRRDKITKQRQLNNHKNIYYVFI